MGGMPSPCKRRRHEFRTVMLTPLRCESMPPIHRAIDRALIRSAGPTRGVSFCLLGAARRLGMRNWLHCRGRAADAMIDRGPHRRHVPLGRAIIRIEQRRGLEVRALVAGLGVVRRSRLRNHRLLDVHRSLVRNQFVQIE